MNDWQLTPKEIEEAWGMFLGEHPDSQWDSNMARRPMKPHVDGYEDEEDCEGYYDPDEAERRGCHHIMNRSPNDPCKLCFDKWRAEEDAKRKAEWAAKTPEEKAQHEAFIKELRKLY